MAPRRDDPHRSHLHDPVPEPPLDGDDARRVYGVIEQLLAKNAQERLRSVAEVRAALSGSAQPARATPLPVGPARATTPATARAISSQVMPWPRSRSRRFWMAAAGAAAVLAVVLGRDGVAAQRRIAPGDLEPGSYRLTLQIEDARGRDAEASHDFTIVER